MELRPVTEAPLQIDPMNSDLLIVKTNDGVLQPGYASFCKGYVHSWFVCRTRDGKPSYLGANFHTGCFEGLEVVGWAYMPSVEEIMKKF